MAIATGRPSTAEFAEYSNTTRWIIMGAVMLGTLMQMIDSSIVNVAIPTMMGNLGVTLDEINWVSTGYILACVIMLPMTGWLSHAIGRRRYLSASMLIFTVASLFCGLSKTLSMLVFFRIIQGIGGAALVSTAQATMMEIFPPEQIPMVQALYGVGVILGPTIGPTLGGWITDNYSWPWIFYINLPIGIFATILTYLFMHDSRYKPKQGGIDFIGIVLLALGLGSLQTLLEKGAKENWFDSTLICWLTFVAVVGLVSFVWWELHTPHPVVNLRILKNRGFAAGTAFGLVLGFGLFGGIFILPVFLQQVRGFTAEQTGLVMLPAALVSGVMMPVVGRIVGKFQPRILTAVGLLGITAATWMLTTFTSQTGSPQIFWPLLIRGAAMGFLWMPLTLATLTGLRKQEMADGTGLFNLSRQLGGSAGIAVLSTFLLHRMDFHYARVTDHINSYSPSVLQTLKGAQYYMIQHGSSAIVARQQALQLVWYEIKGQAAILAYNDVFLLMVAIFLASLPLLFMFEKRMPSAPPSAAPAEE